MYQQWNPDALPRTPNGSDDQLRHGVAADFVSVPNNDDFNDAAQQLEPSVQTFTKNYFNQNNSVVIDNEEVYPIEKILSKRVENGHIQYFVKWLGFNDNENTWEQATHLNPSKIFEYEATQGYSGTNFITTIKPDLNDEDNNKENLTVFNEIATLDKKNSNENLSVFNKVVTQDYENPNGNLLVSNNATKNLSDSNTVASQSIATVNINNDNKDEIIAIDYENKDETLATNVNYDKCVPETIIGITNVSGELMFLIKWLNELKADLVPSKIANLKWPKMVIKFYEERLIFVEVKK